MTRVTPVTFAGGSRPSGGGRGRVTARYDNAQTTPENARQWVGVDYLSAKSANSFGVRRTLRMRSRHEVSNNPFLFGITHSNADDLIDSGPTLQVYTPDAGYNRAVERAWAEWCAEVDLVEKLRAAKLAKTVDGEGFLVLKTVEDLEQPVKLYPCDVEADQVTTPAPASLTELWVDGLTLHPVTGRPTAYHVLKGHPGDFFFPGLNPLAVDKVPARWVLHWFQRSRPGQVRGVPVFTPSLDLFGELRAFRKAVLTNAQIAASLTALLSSEAPAVSEDGDPEVKAFQRVPIDRGMMTTLPAGFKMAGFDPKQPQTTYEMFQQACLGEACRPLSYPLNLALGSSQKFNFSSSKLDHINYRNGLTVERGQCDRAALDPLFRAWFEEAVLCGAVPVWEGGLTPPPHEWHWPGFESIDPTVDAQADQTTLAGGQQTWREFWARRGKDWRDVLAQQKAEKDEIERLGITFGEPLKQTVTDTEGDGEGTGADDRTAQARRRRTLAAAKDANGMEHDDDGKFGEGGGSHKEAAEKAHDTADHHEREAKRAADDGDHEAAGAHRAAEKATRRVAETHEDLHQEHERHAAETERLKKDAQKKLADADTKVAESKKRVEELKKGGDPKSKIEELKKQLAESKKRQRRAKAAVRGLFHAVKDDNGQEHDERGRFGEGGGGGKGDADHTEHHDRWAKEDAEHEGRREAEDDETERKRDKEDTAHDKRRDREQSALDKAHHGEGRTAEKARAKEDDTADKARAKEDEKHERRREKEDEKHERRQGDERDAVEQKIEKHRRQSGAAKEGDELDERQARERAELDRRHAAEGTDPVTRRAERLEQVKRHSDEQEEWDTRTRTPHHDELDRLEEKQEAESREREEKQEAEDAERHDAREREDSERYDAREREDQEREERHAREQEEMGERHAREPDELDEARQAEDDRAGEARQAEDRDRYHRRKAEHPDAHRGYYDDAEHAEHGGEGKADAARRQEVAGV